MQIWLCSPAWRRYPVTNLALMQRRWLCDRLAARGWQANSVIVADDENLDIAQQYGFDTVEMGNDDLGERFNAGYRHAAAQGADIFVHIGSDDWVHPDVFDILDRVDLADEPVPDLSVSGWAVWRPAPQAAGMTSLFLVDLPRRMARKCHVNGRFGCIPWLIPRKALEPSGFSPISAGLTRGIDGALVFGMNPRPNWIFQESQPEWCVDWKTDVNVTPYKGVAAALGVGDEVEPWDALMRFYPGWLVKEAWKL